MAYYKFIHRFSVSENKPRVHFCFSTYLFESKVLKVTD